nr:MAG TPA: hypothetical protein [Caudoviricetes sp.]
MQQKYIIYLFSIPCLYRLRLNSHLHFDEYRDKF